MHQEKKQEKPALDNPQTVLTTKVEPPRAFFQARTQMPQAKLGQVFVWGRGVRRPEVGELFLRCGR